MPGQSFFLSFKKLGVGKKTKMGSNEKSEKEAEIAAAECVTTQPGIV